MAKQRNTIFCSKCGQAAEGGENFCINCGNKLIRGENRQFLPPKAGVKRKNNWTWITAAAIGAVFLVGLVAVGVGSRSNRQQDVNVAHNSVLIEGIVSEFNCNCGSCDKQLKDCDCPTALDEIKYIENAVAENRFTRKEIINKVDEQYGGLIKKAGQKAKEVQ